MPSQTKCSSPSSSSSCDDIIPTKRTRIGKPKVRTGCITCKNVYQIRRVKCDEGRPACERCTSTGRKCDGYGPRPKKPSSSDDDDSGLTTRYHAKRRYTSTTTPTATPHVHLRPLMADVSGTRTERMYFHRFRDIGEEALGIRHVHSGLFWRQIVPQYCREVPAVKHAYIAFAAAYTHFHVADRQRSDEADAAERFITEQYSTALGHVARDCAGQPLRRRYGITMMCCVAFFCVEMLRGDLRRALMHLASGARMMADLPADVADILHNPAKWSRGLDTSYVRVAYMVKLLTRWEVSVQHLAADFQPQLAAQAYASRQHGASVRARSVEQLQDAVDDFCQDVDALAWMARGGDGEDVYWRDPAHRLQYWTLKQRGDGVGALFAELHDCGDRLHGSGWSERRAVNVSLLRYQLASLTLDLLPFEKSEVLSRESEAQRTQELVAIAEAIEEGDGKNDVDGEESHVDVGVIPTLHAAAKHCRDATTKERLLDLIRTWPRRESLWDGPVMRQALMC